MTDKRISARIRRGLLPILVLGSAIALAVWFIKTRPSPQKKKSQPMASAVETLTVATRRHKVTITAMGTVSPVEEVALQPEVSGLVIWKHRNLVPGGIVRQGEILLRIDARNYEAALKQQEAALEKAEVEYQLEMSRCEVAEEEWRMMNPGKQIDPRARTLALRQPQLRAARVAVQAANNVLAKVTLDVERTSIAAPFNAVVIDEFIDRGQLVSPQTRLAQLTGTDAFRVEASLPVRDLQWMKWPDHNGEGGPSAMVLYDIGNTEPLRFNGKVTRVLSSLNSATRMARILVQVQDPLMLAETHADARKAKLLSGAYVKVLIEGLPLNDVIEVPNSVIHEGNRIWVMNAKGRLEYRDVEILWRQSGRAFVKDGIAGGEHVVSSHIASPIPGMKLRVKDPKDSATKRPGNQRKGPQ